MENKKNYQSMFDSLKTKEQVRPAVYLDHYQIDDDASELLSNLLGRDIRAEGKRSEFYDWSIDISNDPITKSELEILYAIIGASEYDKEIQTDTNEYHDVKSDITELCQRILNKLFSKIMPFEVSASHSDDDGVWFFGEVISADIIKPENNQLKKIESEG